MYCTNGCGFVGGRYRWSVVVRRAIEGGQICAHCGSDLRIEGPDGRFTRVPEHRGG